MTRTNFGLLRRGARRVQIVALLGSFACSAPGDRTATERTGKAKSADLGVVVSIDWWMPEMFGTTTDANGIIDLVPKSPPPGTWGTPVVGNPMRPSAWNVMLTGCQATAAQSYVWDIQLPTGNVHVDGGGNCTQWVGFPAQGTYNVTLTMGFADGTSAVGSQLVTVKNYLIVSMGDSIASGEGSPDIPASGPNFPPIWSDTRCHRSANSGHAQAALALEQSDYHSSVRFISVACSGAGIDKGLINGYIGEQPPAGTSSLLAPQINQAAALACPWIGVPPGQTVPPCDPIDALLVTVGANDVGFGDVVRACANPFTTCSSDSGFTSGIYANEKNLPSQYAGLNRAIVQNLNVKQVYFPEYADPTHDENGNLCTQMVFKGALMDNFGWVTSAAGAIGVTLADGQINQAEVAWAHDSVLKPLNSIALAASQSLGWKYVGGIADSFRKHGYCAAFRDWVETYDQSKADEGLPDGTMHPNSFGYNQIAQYILGSLAEDTTEPRPVVSPAALTNGQIRLFGRATDNQIYVQTFSGGAWQTWIPLGTGIQSRAMVSQPVAVVPAPNQVAVFAVDTSGTVEGRFYSQVVGWTTWQNLTSWTTVYDPAKKTFGTVRIQGNPTAVARANGWVDLLARGDDGKLWHLSITSSDGNGFVSGSWEPTNSPPTIGTPSAVAGGPNELDVVATGPDDFGTNNLWHGMRAGGAWSWENKGQPGPFLNPVAGNPTLVSWGPTRLDIFVNGTTDPELWHLWFDGGWGSWEPLGNTLTSDPQAVTWGPGWLNIMARGPDLGVWSLVYDGKWEQWEQEWLPTESGVAADAVSPGRADFYAQWPGGGVYSGQLDSGFYDTYWLDGVVY